MSATPTPIAASSESDGSLVERARRGDRGAFDALVERHGASMRALGVALVHDRAEAEDLAQEAFLRAFRNLDLLADPEKFAPWLRRVMFGVCIDWVRTFRPRLFRESDDADATDARDIASGDPSPLEQVEQRELVERVRAALIALPPHYRTPLTLYHIDGLSHDKVARALGVPVGTVRSLVSRARRRLAALLAPSLAPETRVMIARETSEVLDEAALAPRMLHVLNGDATRLKLERSDVPGTFAVWADVLHEGPVPNEPDDDRFRTLRARFADSRGWISFDDAIAMTTGWYDALDHFREYDEVVLWFEHDLFDQLILIRHLDWFARRDLGATTLSLICIGAFPGVAPFHGLGQLSPDQLASLLGTRQRVSARQTELARAAWRAFTGDDPMQLERVLARDTSALPFLAGAIVRFLEEYPAVGTGLPRTERQILAGVARGLEVPETLFVALQREEERVFMGDTTFWSRIVGLASGPRPLVRLQDARDHDVFPYARLQLTEDGNRVLAGDADWIALDGIDRWLGGVHLTGEPQWRWDAEARRLMDG